MTPAVILLVLSVGLAYHGTQEVSAEQKHFIGSRKVNNLLEKIARIEKIIGITGITEVERVQRIQESLELGFDNTAAFRINFDEAFGDPPLHVTQYSDFNKLHKGKLSGKEFIERPEFAKAVEIFIDEELKHSAGREEGYYYKVNGTEYHFVYSQLGLKDDKNQIWLITNVDEAAKGISSVTVRWLIVNASVQGFTLLFLTLITAYPLYVVKQNITTGTFARLPFFTPIETTEVAQALESYKGGQITAEAELKEKVKDLEYQLGFLQTVADAAAPDIIMWAKNINHEFTFVNQALVDIAFGEPGHKPEEMIGKTAIGQGWWPDEQERDKFWPDDNYVITTGQKLRDNEEMGEDSQGRIRTQTVIKVPDNPHRPTASIGVAFITTDLTEATRTAKEYAEQIELINHLVAHDVLATIKGGRKTLQYASRSLDQMFEAEPGNERLAKIVSRVERVVTSLGVANDLLKERSKMLDLKNNLVNESITIESLVDQIGKVLDRNGLTISNNCAANASILTDETYFKRILINLIENSFAHNSSNSPVVSFNISKEPGFIVFKVSDNGIGMSEESVKNIGRLPGKAGQFNPDSKGSGLGWFTIRQTLEAMDYPFVVESKLGEGTTVTIKVKANE